MEIIQNDLYIEDIEYLAKLELPWENLKNKSILISGATGQIGSCLIDVIMYKNRIDGLDCVVYALGRNEKKAEERFGYCFEQNYFKFVNYDVKSPLMIDDINAIDFVFHLASNTHPLQYSTDPIGTISTNIIGTQNMLEFAVQHKASRCVFASSNEIYGENRGDVEAFNEQYCGYIDCNTLRAGYPESKRCGEAMCQAYIKQKGLDVVIARFTRTYGPTLLQTDTKALSQFIHKGLMKEDIVLKSAGMQYYSYTYVIDAVAGLLSVALNGECGEAYNIADASADIRLKDLANLIADYSHKKVIFEIPEDVEKAGYSVVTKARLASDKIKQLGWNNKYDINSGIIRTMEIMKHIKQEK